MLLSHSDAFPQGYSPGREFTAAGRFYPDHSHAELSTNESRSARTLVALVKAGNAIVNEARMRASEKGYDILVVANNSDGLGHSYAGHLNILLSRSCFEMLLRRRPHLLYRAWVPHLVTAQIYTGNGKIGSENGSDPVPFQLSQRADFMETATIALQTTHARPLINSRDEPLADRNRYARLHIITFDTNMAEYALWLKIGTSQLVLAMIESGYLDLDVTISDPLHSIQAVSHDPTLRHTVALEDGRSISAIDIQEILAGAASRFLDHGYDEGAVPDARLIVDAWTDTLRKLQSDPMQLVGKLDWVNKLALLNHHRERNGVDWSDDTCKVIDHQYGNINPREGLYHTVFVKNHMSEHIVTEEMIRRYTMSAPEDTRAWFRAELLKRFGSQIVSMDWDMITFRKDGNWWSNTMRLHVDDPLKFTKSDVESALDRVHSLDALFETFGAVESAPQYTSLPAYPAGSVSAYDYYSYDDHRRYET
ncbi:MAG: proteasome accessory factor PafA2 family protein, partial [Bacteroidetes bacterium]|nr:proteasome accessory factor PafA2 family protein [Bacteroidota bacterium]